MREGWREGGKEGGREDKCCICIRNLEGNSDWSQSLLEKRPMKNVNVSQGTH